MEGLLTVYSTGGVNKGINLTATSGSSYAPIDFNTDVGLAGQFLATGSTFSNQGILSNQTFLANYRTTGGVHLMASGASGYIEFSTGGFATTNERMRIIANGNVGIGTTSPSAKLEVVGTDEVLKLTGTNPWISSTSATAKVSLGIWGLADIGTLGTNNNYPLRLATNATTALYIDTSQNIGIGTTSISSKLHVKAASATDTVMIAQGTTSQTANLTEWRDVNGTVLSAVNASGYLGIGTSSPSVPLQINKGTGISQFGAGSSGADIILSTNGAVYTSAIWSSTFGPRGSGQAFSWSDWDGNPLMTLITATGATKGNFGIGTTSPTAKLHTKATSASDTVGIFQGTTSQTGNLTEWRDVGGTAVARITSNGRGIFHDIEVGVAGINISAVGGNGLNVSGGGFIIFKSSGVLMLSNSSVNDWDRLQFGGTTSSFPAIKRNGAGIDIRLADDSAYADITAKKVISTDIVRLKGYTVATQ